MEEILRLLLEASKHDILALALRKQAGQLLAKRATEAMDDSWYSDIDGLDKFTAEWLIELGLGHTLANKPRIQKVLEQ